MLTFENLRKLSLKPCLESKSILPPPEFLSSITSNQLSEITVDLTVYPPGEEFDRALHAIRGYDGALLQLSNQLKSSPGKLVLTLQVLEGLFVPDTVFPRFSKAGILNVVGACYENAAFLIAFP